MTLAQTDKSKAKMNGNLTDALTDPTIRPIDEGMQPLYMLTTNFLNLIQPHYMYKLLKLYQEEIKESE